MKTFSKTRYGTIVNRTEIGDAFTKSRQTVKTTVGEDGLGDNSYPVVSINTSNVNVVKSDNVISV